jgi:hypothetical protein
MLVCYAFEERSPWFVLAFAAACALGSAYGFLQGAWPFGIVEAIWAGVALRRWFHASIARLGGPHTVGNTENRSPGRRSPS